MTSFQIVKTSLTRKVSTLCSEIIFEKVQKVFPGKPILLQANCQLVVKGDNYRADSSPFTVDQQERLVKTVVQLKVREAPFEKCCFHMGQIPQDGNLGQNVVLFF